MHTIKKEVDISSNALMTGVLSKVTLFPSDKKGIRFYLNGRTVEASVDNVVSTDHCTVLGDGEVKIMLVEHFMAACAFCGISSLDVCLIHFEMPILDGSSKSWVELFESAGLVEARVKRDSYVIKEPLIYNNGKTYVLVLPQDRFSLDYSVNYAHPDLKHRFVSYDEALKDEIVGARTFGYLKELEGLQKAGFARGVSVDNTVGLTEDGGYTTELRSEFEPAKHKILDLIGDFYLTGINPFDMKIQVVAREAGHAVHVKVAQMLKDKLKKES